MRIAVILSPPALLIATTTIAVAITGTALAQNAAQACIEKGYKPGSAGFYNCLQGAGSGDTSKGGELQPLGTGEAGSILSGSPDSAVTDYTGSTMSGATNPDPNILKQLNSPTRAPR